MQYGERGIVNDAITERRAELVATLSNTPTREARFDALYTSPIHKSIHNRISFILRGYPGAVEDAEQTAWLLIWKGLEHTPSVHAGWAYEVAENAAKSVLRQLTRSWQHRYETPTFVSLNTRNSQGDLVYNPSDQTCPDEETLAWQIDQVTAFNALDSDTRDMLTRYAVQGENMRDIGQSCQRSCKTIWLCIQRARAELEGRSA